MQYREGKMGRVFVLKIEHGEDLLESIKKVVVQEKVEAGILFLLGGLDSASVVVGPKRKEVPPDPEWRSFQDGRELLGTGTVFWSGEEPMIHLHGSVGRGDAVLTGCIREKAVIYLVGEVILLEILGTGVRRQFDEAFRLHVLGFAPEA
ncbi:MAG TPA: PPC domain-containing DNA-binding protein [Spirochaetia bacterium]|nr:PPC domain-containing DNA-binding protein [Spirochaetia bacterium]